MARTKQTFATTGQGTALEAITLPTWNHADLELASPAPEGYAWALKRYEGPAGFVESKRFALVRREDLGAPGRPERLPRPAGASTGGAR